MACFLALWLWTKPQRMWEFIAGFSKQAICQQPFKVDIIYQCRPSSGLKFKAVKYRKSFFFFFPSSRHNSNQKVLALLLSVQSSKLRRWGWKLPPRLRHPLALTFDLPSGDRVTVQLRGQSDLSKHRRWRATVVTDVSVCLRRCF